MLAHAQGNVWNAADPARSLGFSETTVRKYLEAWEGLFHGLLGIRSLGALLSHPKAGVSWETLALDSLWVI